MALKAFLFCPEENHIIYPDKNLLIGTKNDSSNLLFDGETIHQNTDCLLALNAISERLST